MNLLHPRLTGPSVLQPAARVAILAFCIEAAHTLLFIPLLQAYLPRSLHWTPAFPGYALTAFGATRLIVQVPLGRAVDRLGTSVAALSGLGILLACGILFAVARVPLLFLGVACVYGVGASLVWPALFSFVANRFDEELRGKLAAAVQFAEAAGVAVGVGAGAIVVERAGYAAGFGFYLALIGVGFLAVLSGRRGRSAKSVAAVSRQGSQVGSILNTPLGSRLLLLIAVGALLTLAPNLLMPIVDDYARTNLHVQLSGLIVPLVPVAVVGGLAMAGSGAASDRVGRLPLILAGLCGGGVGLWLLGGAHAVGFAVIAAALGTAGYLMTQPAFSAAVFDASSPPYRGAQFGLIMVVQGLAEALAPALGGKVAEMSGPGATFRLAAAVLFVALLLVCTELLLTRRHRQG